MDSLSTLIRIYENALDPKMCEHIIEMYESNESSWERFDNNRKPNFTQLNLTKLSQGSEHLEYINNYISGRVALYKDNYLNDFGKEYFPMINEETYLIINVKDCLDELMIMIYFTGESHVSMMMYEEIFFDFPV
jgi:hypothetical protein